jgi:hypothetical protein
MNIFGFDLGMILAVAGATMIKLFTSPSLSWPRSLLTVFMAVFSAIVFTGPAIALLNLDPAVYQVPMAATLTLTGEGLMRFVIATVAEPKKIIEFLRALRGGK